MNLSSCAIYNKIVNQLHQLNWNVRRDCHKRLCHFKNLCMEVSQACTKCNKGDEELLQFVKIKTIFLGIFSIKFNPFINTFNQAWKSKNLNAPIRTDAAPGRCMSTDLKQVHIEGWGGCWNNLQIYKRTTFFTICLKQLYFKTSTIHMFISRGFRVQVLHNKRKFIWKTSLYIVDI